MVQYRRQRHVYLCERYRGLDGKLGGASAMELPRTRVSVPTNQPIGKRQAREGAQSAVTGDRVGVY